MSAAYVPEAYRRVPHWSFGNSPEVADELLALVLNGRKTATCCEVGFEPKPVVGECSVILDGRGEPACVIETTEVVVRRLDEVDEAFARDEGEGDRTLATWRRNHEAYFSHRGVYAPDMLVNCERFRVVHVFRPLEATP